MRTFGLATSLLALASIAGAQRAPAIDSSCTYAGCALAIIPRLTALDVVRGDREERVASLGFLIPGRMPEIFAIDERAFRHARRAVTYRRIGAALTDLGGAIVLAGAYASARRRDHTAPTDVILTGSTCIVLSVPIHFAADAELSRAVREYNRILFP